MIDQIVMPGLPGPSASVEDASSMGQQQYMGNQMSTVVEDQQVKLKTDPMQPIAEVQEMQAGGPQDVDFLIPSIDSLQSPAIQETLKQDAILLGQEMKAKSSPGSVQNTGQWKQ